MKQWTGLNQVPLLYPLAGRCVSLSNTSLWHESGWTPGVGDGQGGLASCDSWGCKESDTTERLIWSEWWLYHQYKSHIFYYIILLLILKILLSSVQFSHSVVSDSLRPHESQLARPPCPSPTPEVHSNSHPSSRWWHQAISSSVVPFSSCP